MPDHDKKDLNPLIFLPKVRQNYQLFKVEFELFLLLIQF